MRPRMTRQRCLDLIRECTVELDYARLTVQKEWVETLSWRRASLLDILARIDGKEEEVAA